MANSNITRYFVIDQKDINRGKNRMQLIDDIDVLPLTDLQAVQVGVLKSGKIVVHALLTEDIITDMADQTELQDPLSIEGVKALKIENSFAGRTAGDVKAKYQELDGQVEIGKDDDGMPIMAEKLIAHQWGATQ